MGFTTYDAMHIACAESAQVDILLSTDDKLIKKALRVWEKITFTLRYDLGFNDIVPFSMEIFFH